MGRLPLPISDYITDTKTALENSLRVLQALCDAAADAGYLTTTLAVMSLVQSLLQVPLLPIQTLFVTGRSKALSVQSWRHVSTESEA